MELKLIDLNKKIVNITGEVIKLGHYISNKDKNIKEKEYIEEDLTIGKAIMEALIIKLQEDKYQNFINRKHLIDSLKEAKTYVFSENEIELINFSVMRKYDLYEAAQILEELNK